MYMYIYIYIFFFLYSKSGKLCPIDEEQIAEIFLDKFQTNAINKLQCYCKNKQYGCVWTGKVGDSQVMYILMDKCNFMLTFSQIDTVGVTKEDYNRKVVILNY